MLKVKSLKYFGDTYGGVNPGGAPMFEITLVSGITGIIVGDGVEAP
jgi:hypothetical protein